MIPASLRRCFAVPAQWRIAAVLILLVASVTLPDVDLPRRTYDYVVTFDITQSMNVDDVQLDGKPVRRIALARAAMRDVLRHLPCGSKVGWSVFTGYRSVVLLMPVEVCANYEVLLSALDKIGDSMRWGNASNIAKGVYWAMRNAKDLQPARFVFVTDGQEAPPMAMDQSIPPPTEPGEVDGLLIGVGGQTPVRIPKTNAEGVVTGYWSQDEIAKASNTVAVTGHEELSERRDQHLIELAQQNGVNYAPLDSVSSLTQSLLQSRYSLRTRAPTNVRWLAALLGFALLVWNYLPLTPRAATRPARRTRPSAQSIRTGRAAEVATARR